MKIYDCFMVFNEMDLLEIRMNILDPVVDFFVITEATTTQMGNPKEMYYQMNKERFSKFAKKIIYNPIDMNGLVFDDQWSREVYQKNRCIEGLSGACDDDVIIFSDLDEIPNPDKITEIMCGFDKDKVYRFAQKMYYFYLNYQNTDGKLLSSAGEFFQIEPKDRKWLGSILCAYPTIKKYGFDAMRHEEMVGENSVRVAEGGWHFSYMGGTNANANQRIKEKLCAFSHSEYNKWIYYNKISIWLSVLLGRDLLGRGAKFRKVRIDDTYPKWLQEHHKDYPHLLLNY